MGKTVGDSRKCVFSTRIYIFVVEKVRNLTIKLGQNVTIPLSRLRGVLI